MARNSNKDIDFLSVYKTKKKININISMEYDETEDKTLVYMSSPVYIGK